MLNPRGICLLAALLVASGPSRAEDLASATAATKKGDYATAFAILKPLAEKGDAQAQAEIGALYAVGRGAPADPKEALKWTTRAAEQGNASAQANLGTIYLEGRLAPRDNAESMKWSLKAASQGVAAAQANIASMYYDGVGVAQDYKEAAKWMRLAAEQGDAESQMNLGTMYVAGQGVERDLLRGYMWTNLALETLPMAPEEKKSMRQLSGDTLSAEELAKAQAMLETCRKSQFKACP